MPRTKFTPNHYRIHGDALSDIGLRRAVNEDAVLSVGSIFAVADGMGGHEAGDLASRLCIQTLAKLAVDICAEGTTGLPHAQELLTQVERADAAIRMAIGSRGGTTLCALALVSAEPSGGTWPGSHTPPISNPAATPATHAEANTQELSAHAIASFVPGEAEAKLVPRNPSVGHAQQAHHEPPTDVLPFVPLPSHQQAAENPGAATPDSVDLARPIYLDTSEATPELRLMLLNVGDSRGYRLRDGVLKQLTLDHSAVQELIDAGSITEAEARIHPHRNLITRALGAGGNSVPDAQFHALVPGDRYLLCTDGLTGEVEHEGIERILRETPVRTTALAMLIDAALASGGRDNISAIIIDVTDDSTPITAQAQG